MSSGVIMPGRYRSVFHVPSDQESVAATARQQLRAWLASKRLDVEAFDAGRSRVGPHEVVLHSAHVAGDGATSRWQLRERRSDGSWVTTLVVHSPAQDAKSDLTWLWLEVEFVRGRSREQGEDPRDLPAPRAKVPRLARWLLEAVEAYDGPAVLRARPELIRPDRVDELIDVLCDPARRLPTLVASAHPYRDFDAWRMDITRLTSQLAGLASLYILDPVATGDFNTAIGETHRVSGGSVRTYLPLVDPASADDAIRHRVLSSRRIVTEPQRAASLLAVAPREFSAGMRLPDPLARLNVATFTGAWLDQGGQRAEEALKRLEGSHEAVETELRALRAQLEEFHAERRLFDELIEDAGRKEQEYRDQVADLKNDLRAIADELEIAQTRLAWQGDLIRTLQRRLVEAGRAKEAYAGADEATELPKSFSEIQDRLGELRFVRFTGDRRKMLDLDFHPPHATWAQVAWEALLALDDYAGACAAGAFSGDFRSWCANPLPGGRVISPGKVADGESRTVRRNSRMRILRLLPVPREVHPSGRVLMRWHVRIGNGGTVAPRLHFHADTSGTGKVYVGYIGVHLRNTLTN